MARSASACESGSTSFAVPKLSIRTVCHSDGQNLGGALRTHPYPFEQAFQRLRSAPAWQMLHFHFRYAELHLAGKNGNQNHGDEAARRNFGEHLAQRVAVHELEGTIGIFHPNTPNEEIQ